MRIALAVLMALHGVAHVVGFAGSWGLLKNVPRRTTVLSGRLNLHGAGIKVYGIVWLLLGIAFFYAAIGAFVGAHWWIHWTPWIVLVSLVMSVLSWPDSRVGVAVNIVILGLLHVGGPLGWYYHG